MSIYSSGYLTTFICLYVSFTCFDGQYILHTNLAKQELQTSLTLQHHQTILKTRILEQTDCTRGGGVQETMAMPQTAFTARWN